MRITRLVIKNYRGVGFLDTAVSEQGTLFKGGNARGKTSILKAIRAALAGRDISADAIHIGEDRAEILVDMDELSVQRTITQTGSTLKVRNAAGDTKAKPQTVLNELLGTAPLDPIDLYTERDPKKRKAIVLGALPVRVTDAHLQRWISAEVRAAYPLKLPDLSQHGLEVVAQVREQLAEIRKGVNADLKIDRARVEEVDRRLAVTPTTTATGTAAEAEEAQLAASRELANARDAARRAASHQERTAKTRDQIAQLRKLGADGHAAADAIDVPDAVALDEAQTRCHKRIEEAKAALRVLEDEWSKLGRAAQASIDAAARRQAMHDAAKGQEDNATALETALEAGAEPAPTPEAIAALEQAVSTSHGNLNAARMAEAYRQTQADREALVTTERARSEAAGRLTGAIEALTKKAPAELLAESKGIDGLEILEDGGIALNGVAMDALSGMEQLRFAVEIARRANSMARILIVDGLERLDPDQIQTFIRAATADGFQLIATKVDRGDVVIESISLDDEAPRP